jgi:putative transposase
MKQQSFELSTWGGRRRGAGRKTGRDRPAIPHLSREPVRAYQPVHVTLRMAKHVWNLRSERAFLVIHSALCGAQRRPGFRIVHFSVLGNHIHLIVEAGGTRSLANGIRSLSIRLARGLNAMMGRSGPVFEDRYHAHVLRTPAEVRNALRYVVGNFASHAARRGEAMRGGWADPFSSTVVRTPRRGQGSFWPEAVAQKASTWLLGTASASAAARRDTVKTRREPQDRQTSGPLMVLPARPEPVEGRAEGGIVVRQ